MRSAVQMVSTYLPLSHFVERLELTYWPHLEQKMKHCCHIHSQNAFLDSCWQNECHLLDCRVHCNILNDLISYSFFRCLSFWSVLWKS
jgi:hypothetical protein